MQSLEYIGIIVRYQPHDIYEIEEKHDRSS